MPMQGLRRLQQIRPLKVYIVKKTGDVAIWQNGLPGTGAAGICPFGSPDASTSTAADPLFSIENLVMT